MSLANGERIRAFVNMHPQINNAGDALVLRELIALVSSRVPADVYLGGVPDSVVRQLNLEHSARVHRGRVSGRLVMDIMKARIGGSRCYYFLTAGAPNGERTVRQFLVDVIRIAWLAVLNLAGVRICQVGVSFERIGRRHATVLRWRSRLLYASLPRDRLTYDYARKLGIRVTGVMPDVTINMFASPTVPYGSRRHAIAFSFRIDKYPWLRKRLTELVEDICRRTEEADEIVFVAQVVRDSPYMRELAEIAARIRPGRVRFLDCHDDIDAAFTTYSTCRAVLSNRLHALLPGLKAGATSLALIVPELDPKIVGVFESIGEEERVFDFRAVETTDLAEWMRPVAFDGSAFAYELNAIFDELLESAPGAATALPSRRGNLD